MSMQFKNKTAKRASFQGGQSSYQVPQASKASYPSTAKPANSESFGPVGGHAYHEGYCNMVKKASSSKRYVEPLTDRERYVYRAKLAEQAENYDLMRDILKEMIQQNVHGGSEDGDVLNPEERSLLAVAYKNSLGSRRAAWRTVKGLEESEANKGYMENATWAREYRGKIGLEIETIIDGLTQLVQTYLIKNSATADERIFYLKLMADSARYKAEMTDITKRGSSADHKRAEKLYAEAVSLGRKELKPTDPLYLGVCLNFSVFYYEVLNRPDEAVKLARETFETAVIQGVDDLIYCPKTGKDPSIILQLIRDNLSIWTTVQTDTF